LDQQVCVVAGSQATPVTDFLEGPGEMLGATRVFDWGKTSLGAPEHWSQSLRTTLSVMLNSRHAMCLVWGADLIFFYNDAYIPFLGNRHPAALGRPIRDVWFDVWDDIAPLFDQALAGTATWCEDMHLVMQRHGYPEDTWWSFSYSPLRDEDGRVCGVLDVCSETTAKVLGQRRQSFLIGFSDGLRELSAPTQVMAFAAEALGRQLGVGRAGYAEVDASEQSLRVHHDWSGTVRPSDAGRTWALSSLGPRLVAELRAGRTVRIQNVAENPITADRAEHYVQDGTAAFLAVPLIKDGRFKALLYVGEGAPRHWQDADATLVEDVAERTWSAVEQARAETALRQANETLEQRVADALAERSEMEVALRQSQKMEAIGQLTGGIAHDFNNLLTGISGALDLIRKRIRAGRTDGLDRFMDAAAMGVQRGAGLTHRLLAFARRQSLDTRPQDVNGLIAGLEEMLHRTLGETIACETALADDLWPALADANQFENALLNLSINARDAMPDGGLLTIETANRRITEAEAWRLQGLEAGDYVEVSVSDTGSGMSESTIAKAFDPFFTTKPIGQGTGLGLSMVYGFVKQSGGHVRLYSEVDTGTTVRLYLRRAVEEDAIPTDTDTASTAPRGHGETVLVVEDDVTVRLLVTEVLDELGYRYLEAEDARTALPLLQSAHPIHLMVSDVGLPHVSGRQLAEMARDLRPELKILFITGYAEKAALRSGFLAPGMEMMTKPFDMDALGAKIRQLIEG